MIWIIVLIVVAAIAILLLKAASKPAVFSLQRAADIDAPPGKVFDLINDFHSWLRWSPWEGMDPAQQRTYGGPDSGVGANYAWQGSRKVGSGRMEITNSVPASQVTIKIDFLKPFEAHNTVAFTLTPQGAGTHVVWSMSGPQAFMFRVMGTLFSMEKAVGGDFERGLAKLKAEAEK